MQLPKLFCVNKQHTSDSTKTAHLIRRQVIGLTGQDFRERHVQRIFVSAFRGAHGLNERLARFGALGTVVVALICGKNGFLRGLSEANNAGLECGHTPFLYNSMCRCGTQSMTATT